MNPKQELPPIPAPGAADYSLTIVKAGVSAIPVLGGPAAELFGAITGPVLGRRREEWLEELRLHVNDLTRTVADFKWDTLVDNESFTSALSQATYAALKTSAKDKLEALRNAVLNVAAGTAPDEDTQSVFLALVDALTPMHLRLLRLIKQGGTVPIRDAPDWLKSNYSDQAVRDLLDKGLVETVNMASREFLLIGREGAYQLNVKVSANGEEFLRFLTTPDPVNAKK